MLIGSGGNDTIVGGVGDDYLYGGADNDSYVFTGDFGADRISESNGNDRVTLDQGQNSLIFQQIGNSLQVLVAGSTNSVIVDSWYQGADYKIETLEASDGSTITNTQIEQLIQAMASFSTDNGMSWSQAIENQSSSAQSLIAQCWTVPTV